MSIQDLLKIVNLPNNTLENGPDERWQNIETLFGTKLPNDLREFGMMFGTGEFPNLGLEIFNPFSAAYAKRVQKTLDWLRSIHAEKQSDAMTRIFPDRPGLFPWGTDEGGARLCWLTNGNPNRWPVLVGGRGQTELERFDISMTTFLAKILSRQIKLDHIWPPEFFESDDFADFQPKEVVAPRMVHELYEENGDQAFFWIRHDDYRAFPGLMYVKSVGGKINGPIPKNEKNPEVVVDVYGDLLLEENKKFRSLDVGSEFYWAAPDWAHLDKIYWPTFGRGVRWPS